MPNLNIMFELIHSIWWIGQNKVHGFQLRQYIQAISMVYCYPCVFIIWIHDLTFCDGTWCELKFVVFELVSDHLQVVPSIAQNLCGDNFLDVLEFIGCVHSEK